MRALLLFFCLVAPAHADLYRWIDPETGSVKLSSLPPSEPGVDAEVVPYRAQALPKPAATSAGAKPVSAGMEALQARWSEILTRISGISPQDFQRGADGLKQHIEAYEAVRVELDRIDPGGAARRRSEADSLLDKLKQGLAAQFSPVPPGQAK